MTHTYATRDLPLRTAKEGRVNDAPKAYVAATGAVLCDQSNKVCHLTERFAERIATKMNNPGLRAYKHQCGYWHVGHVISSRGAA